MKLFIPLLLVAWTAGLAQGQAPVEAKAEVPIVMLVLIFASPQLAHQILTYLPAHVCSQLQL